jgi:hypothetical protein
MKRGRESCAEWRKSIRAHRKLSPLLRQNQNLASLHNHWSQQPAIRLSHNRKRALRRCFTNPRPGELPAQARYYVASMFGSVEPRISHESSVRLKVNPPVSFTALDNGW